MQTWNWWQKLLLAPFAIVFTCEWHEIHAVLLGAGGLVFLMGLVFRSPHLAAIGMGIGAASLVCMLLFLAIALPVVLLAQMIEAVRNYYWPMRS